MENFDTGSPLLRLGREIQRILRIALQRPVYLHLSPAASTHAAGSRVECRESVRLGVDMPVRIRPAEEPRGDWVAGRMCSVSPSGMDVEVETAAVLSIGEWIRVEMRARSVTGRALGLVGRVSSIRTGREGSRIVGIKLKGHNAAAWMRALRAVLRETVRGDAVRPHWPRARAS